jgi:hypothetical protein
LWGARPLRPPSAVPSSLLHFVSFAVRFTNESWVRGRELTASASSWVPASRGLWARRYHSQPHLHSS